MEIILPNELFTTQQNLDRWELKAGVDNKLMLHRLKQLSFKG